MSCLEREWRSRLDSMLAVDELIGTVVQALGETDELQRTVLIFTSYNGYPG
jgi:membrane-anchored protein YejM (alkaline phosphatase superfamily)